MIRGDSVSDGCIRSQWFHDHIAKHHKISVDGMAIEYLKWKDPNSSLYRVDYVCQYNTLFVTGDIGSAVYQWSCPVNLQWISTCNTDYFHGKCQASEEGRHYMAWEESAAIKALEDHFDESDNGNSLRQQFVDAGGPDQLYDREAYRSWLGLYGDDVFGDGWEDLADIGQVIHPRCRGHLIGLQMAFKQLDIVQAPGLLAKCKQWRKKLFGGV